MSETTVRLCGCGCGGRPRKSDYMPGHRLRGVPKSPEHRAKLRASLIGRPHPGASAASRGRQWSPEQRAQISASLKRMWAERRANVSYTVKIDAPKQPEPPLLRVGDQTRGQL